MFSEDVHQSRKKSFLALLPSSQRRVCVASMLKFKLLSPMKETVSVAQFNEQ